MRAQHVKRRKHHAKWPWVLLVLVLIIVTVAGFCTWLFWPRTADHTLASAQPPQGTIKGLVIRAQSTDALCADTAQAAQKAYLDGAVAFAAEHGLNAVLIDALQPAQGDEKPTVLYRDYAYRISPAFAAENTLFQKFDVLQYLCDAAAAKGLAVYPYFSENAVPQSDEKLSKSIDRMCKRYAVADVYWLQPADENPLGEMIAVNDSPDVFTTTPAAWQTPSVVFAASVQSDFKGIVFDDYETAKASLSSFGLMMSALNATSPAPVLLSYTPTETLAVTYPAQGANINTQNCFVMGTSNPELPLMMNGAEVPRHGTSGMFGILVTLAAGENNFTFTQGDATATALIQHGATGGNTGGSTGDTGGESIGSTDNTAKQDNTVKVDAGTFVRTTPWITSLLYDPSGDNKISETVRAGATVQVTDCVRTWRYGKKTWAYQLASGDYVLAYNTTILGENFTPASFTGASAAQTASGETLTLTGTGQPLAYTNVKGNNLILHFYDAAFAADFAVQNSTMVQSVTVTPQDGYTEVILSFARPLWGHSVEYADGTTQILLKKTPVQSDVFAKPLTGTTVLLDAGHGADDNGAMGTAGSTAPMEKDVNLAVTLATKYRLEQLGATVKTIRTDDTFLTLNERNQMIVKEQPDFFIAIHHNSIALNNDANTSTGTECYYFYDAGQPLAAALVENITAETGRVARGAMWGYFYVTRSTVCPSVLLEVGFMVNPAEYEQVTAPTNLWKTGDAIANSILACVPKE
ncbi:MAG: N-acetylmuramoyl-L-alanine amidase [Ruthenibacterium sp.]